MQNNCIFLHRDLLSMKWMIGAHRLSNYCADERKLLKSIAEANQKIKSSQRLILECFFFTVCIYKLSFFSDFSPRCKLHLSPYLFKVFRVWFGKNPKKKYFFRFFLEFFLFSSGPFFAELFEKKCLLHIF